MVGHGDVLVRTHYRRLRGHATLPETANSILCHLRSAPRLLELHQNAFSQGVNTSSYSIAACNSPSFSSRVFRSPIPVELLQLRVLTLVLLRHEPKASPKQVTDRPPPGLLQQLNNTKYTFSSNKTFKGNEWASDEVEFGGYTLYNNIQTFDQGRSCNNKLTTP